VALPLREGDIGRGGEAEEGKKGMGG